MWGSLVVRGTTTSHSSISYHLGRLRPPAGWRRAAEEPVVSLGIARSIHNEGDQGVSILGLIARTAHQGESRGPRRLGACQCKTCGSWQGIDKDWTTEKFEALQVCVVLGSFAACQDTTVSLRSDFIRWHALPYVSLM